MENRTKEPIYIYGRHAVVEALKKRPEVVEALYLREDLLKDNELSKLVKNIKSFETFSGNSVPRGVDRHATHQGCIAKIDTDLLMIPFKVFRDGLEITPGTALVVLGEVQDPHNVGAIIRSAAAFGAAAVLIPEHRGCPVTGTVIKTSAGMAFSMPLVSVGNINSALRDLKDKGFWVYGLDGAGDVRLHEEQFTKPSVFIVGNEAKGMRQKTHELCDTTLTIPMHPRAESLNASVSAATVLYAWSVQHSDMLD